jgi:hypothetical protein
MQDDGTLYFDDDDDDYRDRDRDVMLSCCHVVKLWFESGSIRI